MTNYEFLKSIFGNAHNGNYNIPELPEDISKEVVEKNLLYIELQNLIRDHGNENRIEEIKAILYPLEEEEDYGKN